MGASVAAALICQDPPPPSPRGGKGGPSQGERRVQDAIRDYTGSLRFNADANTVFNRGNAHMERRDYRAAIVDYTSVLEMNPRDIDALYNRAHAHLGRGNPDEAIKDYSSVLKLDSSRADAMNNRGSVFYGKGDIQSVEAAIDDFAGALEMSRDSGDSVMAQNTAFNLNSAHRRCGDIHAANGNLKAAIQAYSAALGLDPSDLEAEMKRTRSKDQLGDCQNADDRPSAAIDEQKIGQPKKRAAEGKQGRDAGKNTTQAAPVTPDTARQRSPCLDGMSLRSNQSGARAKDNSMDLLHPKTRPQAAILSLAPTAEDDDITLVGAADGPGLLGPGLRAAEGDGVRFNPPSNQIADAQQVKPGTMGFVQRVLPDGSVEVVWEHDGPPMTTVQAEWIQMAADAETPPRSHISSNVASLAPEAPVQRNRFSRSASQGSSQLDAPPPVPMMTQQPSEAGRSMEIDFGVEPPPEDELPNLGRYE